MDAFFTAVDERLQASLPEFESEVLRTVLRIPAHVVVGSELAAAADGFGAVSSGATAVLTPAQVEEEAAVERELVQLQQRVARAAKLNRALRTERTCPHCCISTHCRGATLGFLLALSRRLRGVPSDASPSAEILVAPLLPLSSIAVALTTLLHYCLCACVLSRSPSLWLLLMLPVARFDQDSESFAQFEDAFVSTKKQENANNSTTTRAQRGDASRVRVLPWSPSLSQQIAAPWVARAELPVSAARPQT